MGLVERRSLEKRNRQLIALVSAVAIHAAFFASFLFERPKTLIATNTAGLGASAGQQDGAITVTLLRPPSSMSHTPSTAEALEALRRRLTAETPDSIASGLSSPPRHTSLLDLFGPATDDRPKADKAAGAHASQTGASSGAPPKVIDPMALASLPPALRAEPNLLWSQVARCWRPSQVKSDVIMVIRLDASGQIDGAPVIYRVGAGAALSQAEQDAVRAVRACAPYHTPAKAAAYNLRFTTNGTG